MKEFKNNVEAREYGVSVRGNEPEIRVLEIDCCCLERQLDQVKKGNDVQEQASLAFQVEFYHEAIEFAKQENKAIAPAHVSGCYGEK